MICEAFNFYSYLTTLLDTKFSQTASEEDKRKALIGAGGALLDLASACEDPIRAYAKSFDAQRAANHAFEHGAEAAAEGGAEAEAVGVLGKITAPWVFKAFGVVSAAIDTYYAFFVEAPEADKAGDHAMARAKRTVGAGSLTILVASVANAAGYLAEATLLTAAASALLVAGVIIVAIGWAMTVYFSRTIWQKFVSHSSFGTEHGQSGKENWSGGDFTKWTDNAAGFDLQIQVLTAMMCAFKNSWEQPWLRGVIGRRSPSNLARCLPAPSSNWTSTSRTRRAANIIRSTSSTWRRASASDEMVRARPRPNLLSQDGPRETRRVLGRSSVVGDEDSRQGIVLLGRCQICGPSQQLGRRNRGHPD